VAPVNAATRRAIDDVLAVRPGIGSAYVFPASRGHGYVSRWLASKWLCRAERLAEVPNSMDRSGIASRGSGQLRGRACRWWT